MQIVKFLRLYYNKITQSIAFYPALIAIGFLLLSWGMLEIDFSAWGQEFKSGLNWLSLKDADTARTIIATVAAAIMSLTVFSFSMVMIVLNQAASQMSNRVLNSMIENRFQQIVLGFYIGTTVYALFLLSTIRDISDGLEVPAISIYFLIFLTVIDIFLFIYFLDYVTQTVKYETVIDRIRKRTLQTMQNTFKKITGESIHWETLPYTEIQADESGYFQAFNEARLLEIASRENLYISFLYEQSTFLVKGIVFIKIYSSKRINETCIQQILSSIDFFNGHLMERNAHYGFRQLTEIAIKGLSPGINDPGTAVISIQALSDIFAYRLYHRLPPVRSDENGTARIYIPSPSFEELFNRCIHPIWNYGKHDQYIQHGLHHLLTQLKEADRDNMYTKTFDNWLATIDQETAGNL